MTSQPLISIITLNYNQIDVTLDFLESTKTLTYPNYEIILIDNNSKEDPTDLVKERFPDIRYIRSEENLGFTGGNNLGIREAKGEFLFIVNNDTIVTPDLLEKLLEPFYKDEKIGMVSPKIMYWDQPDLIQYAGYTKINPFTGRNKTIGGLEIDKGQHDSERYTHYAHGAAMLVKKEVIEKVGMFPEHFFIYYEELDWSSRTKRGGYEILYQPEAKIYHKESVTMGKESPIKAYYHNRNRIMFMRRNSSFFEFFVFFFFLVLVIIPKKILTYLFKGQYTHLKNFLRGLVWNLKTPKYI